jgi:hypothetical protein
MGFFSWECECCGESIKSPYTEPEWQNKAVVLTSGGSLIKGDYDGYGRIDDFEIEDHLPQVYHERCWLSADKPTQWEAESEMARDQGFFTGDPNE